jgi:predicted transcriptional regulator
MTVEEFRQWICRRLERESMRQVGELLGLTAATVSRWNSGTRVPCRRTLLVGSLLAQMPLHTETGLPNFNKRKARS